MTEPEPTSTSSRKKRPFEISKEPVVGVPAREKATPATAGHRQELPPTYNVDLFYVIARDPKSLFLCWDLNWKQLFENVGLSPREIHLRVFRADESEENTFEINPFAGYCFVDLTTPNATYSCALGCFDGDTWKTLIRSGSTSTPADAMSEDLSADFATFPLHLSFQRLIDIFRSIQPQRNHLAHAVARTQDRMREIQAELAPSDWSRLLDIAVASIGAEEWFDNSEVSGAEIRLLLETVQPKTDQANPSPATQERWQQITERFANSSYNGASGSGFGGSSAS